MKCLLKACIPLLALVAGEAGAAEVYRSTGPHGEVRFSDVETPGSEAVTVETPEPASGDAGAWVEETLAVALALQEARLAREAAAAERRAAERRAALRERSVPPAPPERTTYAPWYPYAYPWPPYGHRPGRPGYPPPWRPDRPPPDRPPPARPEPPSIEAPIPGAGWAERN